MDHMRTDAERIRLLHARAAQLRGQRTRRQLAGLGTASMFLLTILGVMMQQMIDLSMSITEDSFAGSSLLGESAGGYVLAAVIAFFAGVILTAVIFRYRRR